MRVNEWRDKSLRVRQSEDKFYSQPLKELTLFRFASDDVFVEPHGGAFSIKFTLSGREKYEFGKRRADVKPGDVLLVNAGEIYSSSIRELSESLSIFYTDAEVADAAQALRTSHDALLDQPDDYGAPVEAPQIPLRLEETGREQLSALVRAIDCDDTDEIEQAARLVLSTALFQTVSLSPPNALSDIAKKSTRDELLARTYRAKVYIDDMHGRHCHLDRLAGIACMSKYHFLRVFKEAFGAAPLTYARQVRLETARRKLESGASIAAASRAAEYSDPRAFQKAYRRAFGPMTPN